MFEEFDNNSFDENNFDEAEEDEEQDEEEDNNKNENFISKNTNGNIKYKEKAIKFDIQSIKNFFIECAYSVIETGFTYFSVCLLLLLIMQLEKNIFIVSGFYALLLILFFRVNFEFILNFS